MSGRDWTLPESTVDMDEAAFEPEWDAEQVVEPWVAELDSPFAGFPGADEDGASDLRGEAGYFESGYVEAGPDDEESPEWSAFLVGEPIGADAPEADFPAGYGFEAPGSATLASRIAAVAIAERDRWGNGAKQETDQEMIPILQGYWKSATGKPVPVLPQWHSAHPWSAVFISWVMRRAGARTFPLEATAHRQYISAIKHSTERGDTSSEFWVYPIHRVTPEVGDLVCADRKSGGSCHGATYENIDNRTQWATHGDIVIAVDRVKRLITVVGGNVGQSVKATNYRLDAQGFLVPKQGCGHFAVIKVRDVAAGQAPPRAAATVLSGDALAKAVRLNKSYGQGLGWRDQADAIARLVGTPGANADDTRFAQAIAAWQPGEGLAPDGIVGPDTWAQLRRLLGARQPSQQPSRQPPGFRLAGGGRGLAKYAEKQRLDSVLRGLRQRGLVTVTDDKIDTFQRIANVETGGWIQGINTWDSAVVSSGFLQLTLLHGKLQEWIRRAPSAFQRFGIAVDDHRTYQFPKQDKPQPAIVGAPTADELRWDGWAERFYLSGLDDEVIAAECVLAEEWLKRHLTGLRARLRLKKQEQAADYFQQHYDRSAYLRGMFQAAYNNLPVAAAAATINAVQEARKSPGMTTERFVGIYATAIIAAYVALKDNGSRIVTETKSGLTS